MSYEPDYDQLTRTYWRVRRYRQFLELCFYTSIMVWLCAGAAGFDFMLKGTGQ